MTTKEPAAIPTLPEQIRAALLASRTGHGSYGPNYDGSALADRIETILAATPALPLPGGTILTDERIARLWADAYQSAKDEAGSALAYAEVTHTNQPRHFARLIEADLRAALATPASAQPAQGAVVEYQFRTRPDWHDSWSGWDRCTKEQYEDKLRTPLLHDWHYEVRALGAIATPAEQSTDKPAEGA